MKIFIIPDIHGDLLALETIIHLISSENQEKVHLIFLGDYVDDCFTNLKTIDFLCYLKNNKNWDFTFLIGNHDAALLCLLGQLRHGQTTSSLNNAFYWYIVKAGYGDGLLQEGLQAISIPVPQIATMYPMDDTRELVWQAIKDKDDVIKELAGWFIREFVTVKYRMEFFKSLHLLCYIQKILCIHAFPNSELLNQLANYDDIHINKKFLQILITTLSGYTEPLERLFRLTDSEKQLGEKDCIKPLNFRFESNWGKIAAKDKADIIKCMSSLNVTACVHGHTHVASEQIQIRYLEQTPIINLALGGVSPIKNFGVSIVPNFLEINSLIPTEIVHHTIRETLTVNLSNE